MFDPSKWSDKDWKLWRANNIKLLLEGWTLGSNYMSDGSINEFAEKNGKRISRNELPDCNI